MADRRKQITGRIIAVQEQRFRLMVDDGRGFLLTAAKRSVDLIELARLQNSGEPVRVAYTGEPNLASGVAYSVRPVSHHRS